MTMPSGNHAVAYYSEATLDIDRWFQVADADYRALLAHLDLNVLFASHTGNLRLLDVGCGTGRFPALLRLRLPPQCPVIEYDFLDPSPYCLQVMRESLAFPYEPGGAWELYAQDLGAWESGRYDIVWAIHSLYGGTAQSIAGVIRNLRAMLRPDMGTGLIYIAARNSFYMQIQDAYNLSFVTPITKFLTAEHYAAAFEASGQPCREDRLRYDHVVPVKDHALLESYLHKCVLDASQPLSEWWQHAPLRDLIEDYREGDNYRFPQETALFQFNA